MTGTMNITASPSARNYIAAGIAGLHRQYPKSVSLMPIITFPISTWHVDDPSKIKTTSYNNGPLVSLGLIDETTLASVPIFDTGGMKVAVRLNPAQEMVTSVLFDSDGNELSVVFR